MKEQYKELREDVLDEEKAVDETIERLREIRGNEGIIGIKNFWFHHTMPLRGKSQFLSKQ